jgi:hypothetical protein
MKSHRFALLLLGLLAVGCTSMKKQTAPAPATASAAKPADTPTPVARVLPSEQLNEKNAKVQAQLLEEALKQDNAQTATAQAKTAESPTK